MMKIIVVLTCVAIGLSGCGNKPDLKAIQAQLDQIQQNQVAMWAELESIKTNSLPNLGDYVNFAVHDYFTNSVDLMRENVAHNRYTEYQMIYMLHTNLLGAMEGQENQTVAKIQEVEDGQASDRHAESNLDLKMAEAINDIDTNAIDANYKLNLIKIRLGIP